MPFTGAIEDRIMQASPIILRSFELIAPLNIRGITPHFLRSECRFLVLVVT